MWSSVFYPSLFIILFFPPPSAEQCAHTLSPGQKVAETGRNLSGQNGVTHSKTVQLLKAMRATHTHRHKSLCCCSHEWKLFWLFQVRSTQRKHHQWYSQVSANYVGCCSTSRDLSTAVSLVHKEAAPLGKHIVTMWSWCKKKNDLGN